MKTNVAKHDAAKQQGKIPCYQIRFDQLPYRIDADIITPFRMIGAA